MSLNSSATKTNKWKAVSAITNKSVKLEEVAFANKLDFTTNFLAKTGMNLTHKRTRRPITTLSSLHLFIAILATFGTTTEFVNAMPFIASLTAPVQESGPDNQKDVTAKKWTTTEIPDHAIKRFGQFGERTDFNGFYELKYSPDGTLIAARDRKHRITILNMETESIVNQFQLEFVSDLAFSPDNKFLVTASDRQRKAKIWKVSSGTTAYESKIRATHCSFSQDGSKAILLDSFNVTEIAVDGFVESKLTKWKISEFADRLREYPVAMTDNGKWILSCERASGNKGRLAIFNSEAGERESKNEFGMIPKKVVISNNGRWMGSMFQRKRELHIWDIRQSKQQHFVLRAPDDTFLSFDFSDDGRFVYSSDWKKNIIVWDLLTRQRLVNLKGHTENINALSSAPELLTFATGASGRTDTSILFWDLKPLLFPFSTVDESKDIEPVWSELGSAFAKKSIAATAAVVNQEDLWIPELVKRCKVETRSANQEVDRLIELLQAPQFKVREWATSQLKAMTNQIVPILEEALDSNSAEVRWRVKKILASRKTAPRTNTAEIRRAHRAVLALELIGTDKAMAALEKFSVGHADFNVSEEAKEALLRLKN